MRLWTFIWVFLAVVLVAFTAANWTVLTAPTTINLVVADVTAPMGLTLLGAIAGLTLAFLIFVVWLETKALADLRRARQTSPPGAGLSAEELRAALERDMSELRSQTGDAMHAVIARLDTLERTVKEEIDRASQALTASLRRVS